MAFVPREFVGDAVTCKDGVPSFARGCPNGRAYPEKQCVDLRFRRRIGLQDLDDVLELVCQSYQGVIVAIRADDDEQCTTATDHRHAMQYRSPQDAVFSRLDDRAGLDEYGAVQLSDAIGQALEFGGARQAGQKGRREGAILRPEMVGDPFAPRASMRRRNGLRSGRSQ